MIFQVQVVRQLKPARTERKKLPVHIMRDQDVFLLVNIHRAHNLPVRVGESARAASASASTPDAGTGTADSNEVRSPICSALLLRTAPHRTELTFGALCLCLDSCCCAQWWTWCSRRRAAAPPCRTGRTRVGTRSCSYHSSSVPHRTLILITITHTNMRSVTNQ